MGEDSNLPRHLIPRLWIQDEECTPEMLDGVPKEYIRSDGMFLTKLRSKTLCGLSIKELDPLYRYSIVTTKEQACPDCWDKRW